MENTALSAQGSAGGRPPPFHQQEVRSGQFLSKNGVYERPHHRNPIFCYQINDQFSVLSLNLPTVVDKSDYSSLLETFWFASLTGHSSSVSLTSSSS